MYEQIAQSIQVAIAEDWNDAVMDAIFYDGRSTYLGEDTRTADGASRSFATQRAGERAFRELREKFREMRRPMWGQARFEIQSSGKFKMAFGYENCDDKGNTRFDEEAEIAREEERFRRLTSE